MWKYLAWNAAAIICAVAAYNFAKGAPWEQLAWVAYIAAIAMTLPTLFVAHSLYSQYRAFKRNNSKEPTIDIGSEEAFPAGELSNFTARSFTFRGIICASMEGLLQSLKSSSIEEQIHICTLVGKDAKRTGRKSRWKENQTLYWQGEAIDRHSDEYQQLIDEAFDALYTQNKDARMALLASGNAVLTHSVGKNDPNQTVLTEYEFCSRLMQIRNRLKAT
jgi:predicted NAD-dependent protein-ADP-ribosyltransferase YbiA (DUF1768 family)